jgi:hypothetical protein
MREFKFFRGYEINPFVVEWEQMNNHLIQPLAWTGTTYQPTWITNPGYIVPQPYTITTTPGTGTYTIPFSGTGTSTTGFSLTTSNTNGTVTTIGGIGGAFTTTGTISTNTFYNSNIK